MRPSMAMILRCMTLSSAWKTSISASPDAVSEYDVPARAAFKKRAASLPRKHQLLGVIPILQNQPEAGSIRFEPPVHRRDALEDAREAVGLAGQRNAIQVAPGELQLPAGVGDVDPAPVGV